MKDALLVGGLALFLAASSATGYYLWRHGPALFNRGQPPVQSLPEADPEQVRVGRAAYLANCAQCHGARAEGSPDWKQVQPDGTYLPPPHDSSGHTWHHSDQLLFRIVRDGGQGAYGYDGFESRMPAFGDRLSDEEIKAIIAYLKTLWGQTEREFQASVTEQELGG